MEFKKNLCKIIKISTILILLSILLSIAANSLNISFFSNYTHSFFFYSKCSLLIILLIIQSILSDYSIIKKCLFAALSLILFFFLLNQVNREEILINIEEGESVDLGKFLSGKKSFILRLEIL